MNSFICFVALSASLFSIVLSLGNDTTWEYFLLVQQWPQSLCVKEEAGGRKCSVPKTINYWTIHGLWPSNDGETSPSHCRDIEFDKNQIKDLIPTMELHWTDYLPDGTLWKHEWFVHGTCALSLEATQTEHQYFEKGLELANKYDFTSMLKECGIKPSRKKYKTSVIQHCLKNRLGVDPDLHCFKNKKGELYLSEIRLCITKSFVLENCHAHPAIQHRDKKSPTLHHCDAKSRVIYPILKYL